MKTLSIPHYSTIPTWNEVPCMNEFHSPWDESLAPETQFACFTTKESIHFRFKSIGPKPLIHVVNNHKLEVRYGERVELFFRNDANLKTYYCLEIDPLGRVLDYKAEYYRNFNRDWHWPDSLNIKAQILSDHYIVEGQIPIQSLEVLGLINNNTVQAGIYRGYCKELVETHSKMQWLSWVDPNTQEPDFHVPESFGIWKLNF